MSSLDQLYGEEKAGEGEESASVLTNTDTEEGEEVGDIGVAEFKPMDFTPLTMGPSIEDMMAKSKAMQDDETEEEHGQQQQQQQAEVFNPDTSATSLTGEEDIVDVDPNGIAGDSLGVGTYEEQPPSSPKRKKKKKKQREMPSAMLEPDDANRGERQVSWSDQLVSFSDDEELEPPPPDDDYTPPSEEEDDSSDEERQRKKKKKKKKKKKRRKRRKEEEEQYDDAPDDREDIYYMPPLDVPEDIPELETDEDSEVDQDPLESLNRQAGDEEENPDERFDDEYREGDDQYDEDERSEDDQSEDEEEMEEERRRKNGIFGGLFARKTDNERTDGDSVDISDLSPQEEAEKQKDDDNDNSNSSNRENDIETGEVRDKGAMDDSENDSRGDDEERDSMEDKDQEEAEEVPPEPPLHQQRSAGMSRDQLCCAVFCCMIVSFGLFIVASFIGTTLAMNREEDNRDEAIVQPTDPPVPSQPTSSPTLRPTRAPTSSPTSSPTLPGPPTPSSVFDCPEGNSPLEFRIVFDAEPGEVGLRVVDEFGLSMWNFPVGSFGSFALLLRENIFTLCLSPFQTYTFEIIDGGEDGLVSTLGTDVFGSFNLRYEDREVTSYNGDCESSTDECGAYCRCTYELLANGEGSTGGCSSTDCTPVVR